MELQRTEQWLRARLGHVTASEFSVAMGRRNGSLTQGAETYLCTLIGEHLTREPGEQVTARPLEWGIANEPAALGAYIFETGLDVEPQPFHRLEGEILVGASPDGFVEDGLVEVKCPYSTKEHVRNILTGDLCKEHYAQVQGNLWVTGREWCDYVSYDPRVQAGKNISIVRVQRSEPYIKAMSQLILEFRDIMLRHLESMNVEPFIFVE